MIWRTRQRPGGRCGGFGTPRCGSCCGEGGRHPAGRDGGGRLRNIVHVFKSLLWLLCREAARRDTNGGRRIPGRVRVSVGGGLRWS